MNDDLQLLQELPRHRPPDALRRQVRVAALDRLAKKRDQPRWRRWFDQLAIPLALAGVSLVYLARAAADTPLLR
jgi:hypothetical protein